MRNTGIIALLLALCGPSFAQEVSTAPAAGEVSVSTAPAELPGMAPSKPARAPGVYPQAAVPISGIVLTPTAYRGRGRNEIGLGLDFNAAYYIGRLYGKNSFDWTLEKKNYIDRLGVWFITADGKMLIQTEDAWRPAMAAGAQGTFAFRDSNQAALNSNRPSVSVDDDNTNTYATAYLALTKHIHPKFIINAGYADGDLSKSVYMLSEFLSERALSLNGYTGREVPTGALFAGFIWLPRPNNPLAAEVVIPQGAPMSPKLVNLQLGTLLKLNFQLSYLKFDGGWDLLGMFQFRYSHFPK
ncbi:MAG: hypothetical protein RDU13_07200 [Elusimicrobiales bacterium]|jgi:hypothetical protein|nr:hypothetical protein [Elusimicrobiales bacterium]